MWKKKKTPEKPRLQTVIIRENIQGKIWHDFLVKQAQKGLKMQNLVEKLLFTMDKLPLEIPWGVVL